MITEFILTPVVCFIFSREFALATAHVYAREHGEKQSAAAAKDEEDGRRPFFACDLVAQSGKTAIAQ